MKIGMIIAIPQEIDALFRSCGKPTGVEELPGFTVYTYEIFGNPVYAVGSGEGEISAASATQLLISRYGVELIVNFGVCGGLIPEMGLCRTVVVEKAVHYDMDCTEYYTDHSARQVGRYLAYPDIYLPATPELVRLAREVEPELHPAICASADKFVVDVGIKRSLNERFAAEICDMESAGIILTANRNQVPVLLIKGVSDSVHGGEAEFAEMVHVSAEICVRILLQILRRIG